jgi:hypothetical protein
LRQPAPSCGLVPAFKTVYTVTINGTSLTLTQRVENVPMTGMIDRACRGTASLTQPPREFALTFDPAALTASGTYKDGNAATCVATYNLTMTLQPGAP